MPIIDVCIVGGAEGALPADGARMLADALGKVLGAAPGRVWVRLQLLPKGHYAENDSTLSPDELPVFVTVLHAHLPPADALVEQAAAIAQSVANVLQQSADRVHIEFAPPGAGRIAFGGRLVR